MLQSRNPNSLRIDEEFKPYRGRLIPLMRVMYTERNTDPQGVTVVHTWGHGKMYFYPGDTVYALDSTRVDL